MPTRLYTFASLVLYYTHTLSVYYPLSLYTQHPVNWLFRQVAGKGFMESPREPVRQSHVTFEDDLMILVFLTLVYLGFVLVLVFVYYVIWSNICGILYLVC